MRNLKSQIFLALNILFGAIFIFSSITKFLDIDSFKSALVNFNLLEEYLIPIFAYAIPILEIFLGLLIILNIKPKITIQLTTYLIALFTAVVVVKIFEGAEISCNCFGNFSNDTIDYFTVLRNIFLLIWGIVLSAFYNHEEELKGKPDSVKFFSFISKPWIKQTSSLLIITLFFFLSIQVIVLAIQNRELKGKLSLLIYDKDTLQEGDEAKPFIAQDLTGNDIPFFQNSNGNKKSLLFIFSTGCKACELNIQNWNTIADTLKNKTVNIFGLSVNRWAETKDFTRKFNFKFPVFALNDENFATNYKTNKTPQTILIDEKNKVIRTWAGFISVYDLVNLLEKI